MARSLDIKAVALDFDGVVTNLDVDWRDAVRRASEIAGYEVKSLNVFYETNGETGLFKKISDEIEKLELDAIKKTQPKQSIKEFLQKIREEKIKIFMVSMQSRKVVETFLNMHGLAGYFEDIITRDRCPSKRTQVECILKQTGITASEVLLIEDSKKNIGVCRKLGVVCFLFDRNASPKKTKHTWNRILGLLKIGNLIS
ncbi:MAG: HAD hydrolase-like protein [Candidatus Bathyarchaeota archaeon]|nr:HAD hydrolase-like protein [Candidatus Bathyarchaeota archaeon]